MKRISGILLLVFLATALLKGQAQKDSVQQAAIQKRRIYSDPRKASIMSAVVPGLGQAYNRRYWKIPVIYAGLAGFSYYFYINNGPYNDYRRALRESDTGPGYATVAGVTYSTENLQILKNDYKRQRDLGAIGIMAIYLLNIIDANVDAHLRTFDVSDDLSLNINPWLNGNKSIGLSLHLTLK